MRRTGIAIWVSLLSVVCIAGGDGTVVQEVLEFGGSSPLSSGGDPQLQAGFPVQTLHTGGTYHGGMAVHTLLADIDGDGKLEIVVTSLATGPLEAWRPDGTVVEGWPPGETGGAGYMAAGNLGGSKSDLEVFAGFWGSDLAAVRGDGSSINGWPRTSANFVTTPPALADIDGDGTDEIFIGEEDWKLHGYRADGTVLPGWPVAPFLGGQERHTPAIGDIDADGDLEIVSTSGSSTPGVYLFANHHDGSTVDGFPVLLPSGHVDTYAAIGDVDGDLAEEIVIVARQTSFPWLPVVTVLSGVGVIERSWTAGSRTPYGTAPALADMNGDTFPEIIVQTDEHLEVWDGFGVALPGWPQLHTTRWHGNSSPVVGDANGDGLPDIVVTTHLPGSSENGDVRAYDRNGAMLPGFPKSLPIGKGAVPAIGDIDADGRNEIVITGSFWNGFTGQYDKVWAYDLGGSSHGPVQWGQLGGGPRHAGHFTTAVRASFSATELSWNANDAASGYDVVSGDLETLRATGGDFVLATDLCAGEDVGATALGLPDDPPSGRGVWFLVRPVTILGAGTYDAASAVQAEPRDAEIGLAGGACS